MSGLDRDFSIKSVHPVIPIPPPSPPTQEFTPALATIFEASGRFITQTNGTGSATYSTGGLVLATGATATSSIRQAADAYSFDSLISTFRSFYSITNRVDGTDYESYFGVGVLNGNGSGITYTGKHVGWKIIRTASTTIISATQADGTTETASDIGITDPRGNWYIDKQSSTNVLYYNSAINSGTYELKATLTTNVPTSGSDSIAIIALISNVGVASNSSLSFGSASYQAKVVA